jgi:uncharacterized lipoprotein YddW (UPF0748 family)
MRLVQRQAAPLTKVGRPAALGILGLLGILGCSDGLVAPSRPNQPPMEPTDSMTEARALWVTRFDWRTAAEVRELVDSAAISGFNIIYFQVRGNADAFYTPGLEPWSSRLSGTLGMHPGWDPLQTAVSAAQVRGIELHAWVNAFYGWPATTPLPGAVQPSHSLVQHPDWWMVDAGGQPQLHAEGRWLSPASVGARTRLAAVAADLVRRYAVAGIHLDFIRYPARSPVDSLSQALWLNARVTDPALTLDDFRRQAVSDAVRLVRDSLRAARPRAVLSAAVWGIHRNTNNWSAVSTGYDDRLQDAWSWAAQGLLDVLVPMVYWPISSSYAARTDFAFLSDQHAAGVTQRHVYIGLTLEHMETGPTFNVGELVAEIERARQAGAEGVSVLSGALLKKHRLWSVLAAGPFKRKARLPSASWLPVAAVSRP